MQRRNRLATTLVCGLFVSSMFVVLLAPPVVATPGRDSPSAAADCMAGPYEGLRDRQSYVENGPPLVEDYYRCFVWEGQMFQAALWTSPDAILTVHRSVEGSLEEFARSYVSEPANVGGTAIGLADLSLLIFQTELVYIKVSPPASAGAGSIYYNLYFRAYNATVLGAGDGVTTTPGNDSINGWSYPWIFGYRFTNDYYWINASNGFGGNNLNYRVTLNQDCSTAMYDIFLFRFLDYDSQSIDLVNHSFALERRLNRAALTTNLNMLEFAPSLYDGMYLLRVHAAENGSYAADSPDRFSYSVSVTTVGGYTKDGNDRLGDGQLLTITQSVTGHIDQRDDSADWVRLQLVANDVASLSVNFNRANGEITTLGLRYRLMVFAPNGTVVADRQNWGVSGGNLYFNPYLTIPSFTVGEDGIYHVGIFTADGALNFIDPHLINTGGVGRNWADWTLTASLPNRAPYINPNVTLPETIVVSEDSEYRFSMAGSFVDPEAKIGYPIYGPVTSSSNLTATIGSGIVTVRPAPDWNGNDQFTVTVKDDVPANQLQVTFNVTVLPVNDAPRIYPGAANYSVVIIDEDGSVNLTMRSIFYDVDDVDLVFTAGGLSGQKVDVVINNASQKAIITPDLNWNGELDVIWTATDGAGLLRDFVSHVIVRPVNDPPRATDTRLPRIVIDEGQDFFINLTSHFFDFDSGDELRYYGSVDASVSKFIRVNNTNLDPRDPNMRVYVIDQYRSNYFTNGPVPIKFWVLDSQDNVDGTNGIATVVEKSTFLEIVNVNDAPIVDEVQPAPSEVAITDYSEGDSITFAVTRVVDPDNSFFPDTDTQFFYKWFVNGVEIVGQTTQTFVFRTVLDATQAGQWSEGEYTVSVQVFDAAGSKAQQEREWEFTVLKKNRQPTVQVLRPTQYTFEEGTPIQFQALIGDDDPEDLSELKISWTYRDADGNVVLVGETQQVERMLDPGTYTVTVSVTDGIETVTRELQLTVTEHELSTPGFEGLLGVLALGGVAMGAGAARAGSRRKK